jgi:hypothetical protein
MPPPTKSVLDKSCHLLLVQFAGLEENDPRVNCSEAYSREIASLETLSTAPQIKVFREQQVPTNMTEQEQERHNNKKQAPDAPKRATDSERQVNREKKAMQAQDNHLRSDQETQK